MDLLVLDIAHGHAEHSINALKELKDAFPETEVVVGNVATEAGAEDLCEAGADAIKVGVGPGGVCTTKTGCWGWCPTINCNFFC